MHLNHSDSLPPSEIAQALSVRLEAANLKAQGSGVSQELIDCVLKVGLAFAVFLTELIEGAVFRSQEQIAASLEQIEHHCFLIENEFPVAK
jgi:hypothetical protein